MYCGLFKVGCALFLGLVFMRWMPSALLSVFTTTPAQLPRDTLLVNFASPSIPCSERQGIFFEGSTLSFLAQKELEAEKTAQLQQIRGVLNDAGFLFLASSVANSYSASMPILVGWGIYSSAREFLSQYNFQEKVKNNTSLQSLLTVHTHSDTHHTHSHSFLTRPPSPP